MAEILSFVKKNPGASEVDLCNYFLTMYQIDVPQELQTDIIEALNQLLNLGIISVESDIESIMTSKAIANNQLYHALIEITYSCNLSCKHCYAEETTIKKELSLQQIKHVIDQLYAMNVMYLTFTGGEVLVRPDFKDILDYAVEKGFVIEIFSNGTLLDDSFILYLSSRYIKCFHCSLYSHIPKVHDSITGVKGSFDKTVTALKKLHQSGISINIKTVIMNDNKSDLDGLIKLSQTLDASLQVGFNITPKNSGDITPTYYRVNSVREYEDLLRTVYQSKTDGIQRINPPERNVEDSLCGAGLCSISINPYGEVFPCNGMTIKIGDINKESIDNIWNHSPVLKQIRATTFSCVSGCESCNIKTHCSFCIGQSLLENNGQLKKYPEACMLAQASFNIQEDKNERR